MRKHSLGPMILVVAAVLQPLGGAHAAVRYVALDGSGADGKTWATAYRTIQAAVDDSAVVAGDEIWVKQGTYVITKAINVDKAVKIYGGYSGVGSTRDREAFPTTVDGDNDPKHGFDVRANATIDGFTITRGSAWGMTPGDMGGGMYIGNCSAVVSNCTFYRNEAAYVGGGIATEMAGHTRIENCEFIENRASYGGGGMYNESDDGVEVIGCTFVDNESNYSGGGMFNHDAYAQVTGCTFQTNETLWMDEKGGGGMLNEGGAPTISDCVFTENIAPYGSGLCNWVTNAVVEGCTFADCDSATLGGGGIYSVGGAPTIVGCLFRDNYVDAKGGAILDQSGAKFINCVIWNNSTMRNGGGIYIDYDVDLDPATTQFVNCTVSGNGASKGGGLYSYNASATLTNCIIWGNQAVVGGAGVYNYKLLWPVETVANYCNIEGDSTYPGTGNLRIDPQFEDPTAGDFHLLFGSPCADQGDNGAVGDVDEDYDGNLRITDGDGDGSAIVDMGAYEIEGPPDHIARGEIIQSVLYDNPDDTSATYVFTLLLETDDTVDHIEFQAPAGPTVYVIPNEPYTAVGSVETFHRVDGSTHVWEYWAELDSAAALASQYGDGVYRVTARLTDGSSSEMEVAYLLPGGGNPIPQPTQKPQITDPAYGAVVNSPVTLTWNACTDTNVNSIYLTIVEADTGTEVASDIFPKTATSSNAYGVGNGVFDVDCAFANLYEVLSTDATPFQCGKAVLMGHSFEVLYASVYRFYAYSTRRHFYTISERERDKIIEQYSDFWTYEGPVFNAFTSASQTDLLPVYRFWSPVTGAHFYTIQEREKDKVIDNYSDVWTFEGVAFYAYAEEARPAECAPVHRFWKPRDNTHFYTISEAEKNKVIDQYGAVFTYEGVAFYAYP